MAGKKKRILSERPITLADGSKKSTVTLTRVVTFADSWYGEVKITRAMLNRMVKNFTENTYGQKIAIDVAHRHSEGAAGFVEKLFVEKNRLRAEVAWTDYGVEAIQKRGFHYLSADYHENYPDPETGKKHGCTLMGAGLTVRPRVKNLDQVTLSQEERCTDSHCLIPPELAKTLSEEDTKTMKKYLGQLRKKLEGLKLSEEAIESYLAGFEKAAKQLSESDETMLESLVKQLSDAATQLSELQPESTAIPPTIQLSINQVAPESDSTIVAELVKKELAEQDAASKKLSEDLETRQGQFSKLITDAEGLSENTRKRLSAAVSLVTASMDEAQVIALAENQIQLGQEMESTQQLAAMGYDSASQGTVRISADSQSGIVKLQEGINDALKLSAVFSGGGLRLAKDIDPFVAKVLSEYDRINAPRLELEQKMLAGGETGIGDTNLPAGFTRTVIREALHDLRVLELVQTLTDFTATQTTNIPYEQRNLPASVGDGIVFEGQAIQQAGVSQEMDFAYILPMKLALLISNEVIHFSRSSAIDWDAYARNVASNARIIRELIVRRICNELQRVSDQFGAMDISDEDISGQLNGTTVSIVKSAQYPIVRSHQVRNLKGQAVGSEENPLVVQLNSVALSLYNPAITQGAGTYYRITNYNLGYIQYVDETGTPVTPAASAGDDFISYSYATNATKFDLDLPANTTEEVHMNGLLRSVGARKAMMSADRYVMPDYMLMSPVLNDKATNAETYSASAKRDGADTTSQGDLSSIKAIPAFSTNAPGVDLGDERIQLGVRNTLTYTVAKPFQTGTPFEAVDSDGKPIGKKVAYGEEYSAVHVPSPLRGYATAVIAYSFTNR
ncbi:MAG: hypothetical protein HQL72_02345 [Magnetococcales bacterium]|nr:hypothetical protein [Magnetococcales bacterium]